MEEEIRDLQQQVSKIDLVRSINVIDTYEQIRQVQEEKVHTEEENRDLYQQLQKQRTRELEEENCGLHRQVQQLQEQVSSVVFHHTCTVCGVCRWLLLCPHTHSWQERSSPTGW